MTPEVAGKIYDILMSDAGVSDSPWLRWSFCYAVHEVGVSEYTFDSQMRGILKITNLKEEIPAIILLNKVSPREIKLVNKVNKRITTMLTRQRAAVKGHEARRLRNMNLEGVMAQVEEILSTKIAA